MSENTPLLSHSSHELEPSKPKDVYDRFSRTRKRLILTVIILAGLMSPLASACFVPCIPVVAKDLKTTGTIINYTVGAYVFTLSVGNLVWAPYARFYGRQPVYLVAFPLVCLGSLSAAMSVNALQLGISRTIQAFGASCTLSVGAAIVSDLYRLEERGTAMGIFLGVILLAPTLGPLIGGAFATYASWRGMQFFLFAMGLMTLIVVAIFLPETSHPGSRGVDRLLAPELDVGVNSPQKTPRWKWVWLNPFSALALLRGPNILFVSISGAITLICFFVLTTPLSYTLGPPYHITSPVLIGLCLLPSGLGNMVGAYLAGRLADRAVIKGMKRRGGKWAPEDRLIAAIPGALVLVPISILAFGLTTQFIPGTRGLVISVVCLFMNGVGVDMVLSPSATYIVDILHSRSAEAMAVMSAFRLVLSAIACAGVLPAINKIGVGATNGFAAILAWLSFGLLWVTIQHGDRLRAWGDIDYVTSIQDS